VHLLNHEFPLDFDVRLGIPRRCRQGNAVTRRHIRSERQVDAVGRTVEYPVGHPSGIIPDYMGDRGTQRAGSRESRSRATEPGDGESPGGGFVAPNYIRWPNVGGTHLTTARAGEPAREQYQVKVNGLGSVRRQ